MLPAHWRAYKSGEMVRCAKRAAADVGNIGKARDKAA
jgi:hypothetical protein